MTHDDWENGASLTVHNATKSQLIFMVKDRDRAISRLYKQIEEKENIINNLIGFIGEMAMEVSK